MTLADWFSAGSALAGALSAYAAFRTIKTTVVSRQNETALNSAVRTLERAYTALTGGNGSTTVLQDRLAWLTSARLIEEYKALKALIKDEHVLRECNGHEEHWRHEFYKALEAISKVPASYYSHRTAETGPIHPVSAVIVHAFASWPKGKDDPIDAYKNTDEAVEKLGLSPFWFGLRSYLKAD